MTNRFIQVLAGILIIGSLGACANTSQEAYYKAVERSAIAQQEAHTAKMQALASMAAHGDDASKGAAVMAMALTQAPVIAPQYVQSESLQWAKTLATPVAAIAGIAINADVAKNASDNATRVQLANFESNEAIQLGQQDMLIGALNASGAGADAAINGLVDLGTAGFAALNTAGEQTSDVAVAGLGTADSIATTGFQTTGDVATLGFASLESVSVTGMQGAVDLGTVGLSTAQTLGLGGLDALNTMSTDYNGLIGDVTLDNNNLTQGIVTDYTDIVEDYNDLVETITTQGLDIDNTEVCTIDPATATVVCN